MMPSDRTPRPVRAVVKWVDFRTGRAKRQVVRIKRGEDGFDMPRGVEVKKGDSVTIEVWWG